jgi:hypothetical protein
LSPKQCGQIVFGGPRNDDGSASIFHRGDTCSKLYAHDSLTEKNPGNQLPALSPLTAAKTRVRVALYLRVSTRADKRDNDDARPRKRQKVDNQRRQLREFCETQGWHIIAEYVDEESGAKSDRAGFQQMWKEAAQRRFDVLLFWVLDRFSREGVLTRKHWTAGSGQTYCRTRIRPWQKPNRPSPVTERQSATWRGSRS